MMDRSPPPFVRPPAAATFWVLVFTILALVMMGVDAQRHTLAGLRQHIADALYPAQRIAQTPRDRFRQAQALLSEVSALRAQNAALQQTVALNAQALLRVEHLTDENRQLRALSGLRTPIAVRSLVAEVLYETRDPFDHKLILDKGLDHQIGAGQPVIDGRGLVGQVTRASQHASEMTPVTHRDFAVSVQIQRTGMRTVAFGDAVAASMELRNLNAKADIRAGDIVVTSGLDKLYPPGLPVGRVAAIVRADANDLVKARVEPAAQARADRMIIVLRVDTGTVPSAPAADATGTPNHTATGTPNHTATGTPIDTRTDANKHTATGAPNHTR